MEEIIISSLMCVVESIQHRKNSYELYGYDFMLAEGRDPERPEVWLIEVNSSPACDYSTPVTTPLVKQMMEDTAKIMVDQRANPAADTGEWERMRHCHNRGVAQKVGYTERLEVIGKPMRAPKGFRKRGKKKKRRRSAEKNTTSGPQSTRSESGTGATAIAEGAADTGSGCASDRVERAEESQDHGRQAADAADSEDADGSDGAASECEEDHEEDDEEGEHTDDQDDAEEDTGDDDEDENEDEDEDEDEEDEHEETDTEGADVPATHL